MAKKSHKVPKIALHFDISANIDNQIPILIERLKHENYKYVNFITNIESHIPIIKKFADKFYIEHDINLQFLSLPNAHSSDYSGLSEQEQFEFSIRLVNESELSDKRKQSLLRIINDSTVYFKDIKI
jgi:hypothetical protein